MIDRMRTTGAARGEPGLHTLGRWTTERARSTPGRVAIVDGGVETTYAELERRASALADGLIAAGHGPGERIATLSGNCADHVVLFFACAKAGLVLAPLSWRLSPRELAEQLELADPALLVVADEYRALAEAGRDRLLAPPPLVALGAAGIEREAPGAVEAPAAGADRAVADDDPLLIVFTSGTLGRPKAAVLTHANCFWTNLSLSRIAEIDGRDVVLAFMPEYHVGGWNIQPLLAWWTGATVVLERSFDAGRVLRIIERRRVTTMMGVPTHYLMLAQHRDFAGADLTSLRHAIVGGASMPESLLRAWHGRGVALAQGYGLTEASPNVLCLAPEDAMDRVGSAGRPYPYVQVRLVDPVTGDEVVGAGRGELVVRGPGVFAGYFRDPAATAAALRDGWLSTGDLAERAADGCYRIVDRIKDIFISGGESIAPSEVERILFEHPAVADAAVVGVPDERWGEVGVAWVVVRAGRLCDEQELREHCRRRLAAFKAPTAFRFVDEIPRAGGQKVLRRLLLERWMRELAASARTSGEGVR